MTLTPTLLRLVPGAVGVVLAAACAAPPREAHDNAAGLALPTAVVESTDLPSSFEAGGVVRARSTAAIASRVMAPIVRVDVSAGDRVRRGAPVIVLDSQEMTAARTRAAATLQSAVEAARAAESEVRSAQAAAALAQATRDRIRTLHEKRSATPQELDQASSASDMADANVVAARARLAAANASRDAAHAATDAATIATSYATLTAPFDGVVTERAADPGSMATPGVPLLTIEDVTAFRLEVAMDEARAGQVTRGQTVDVTIGDAGTPDRWTAAARVGEVARIDPGSHSFLIKLDLPDDPRLRSGLFGRARFAGPSRRSLTVPLSAMVRRGQLAFVFTVDSGSRARLQPVSSGDVRGDRIEILAGVREGEQVISNPPAALSDGAAVSGARP